MRLLGILRASSLLILASAFQGHPVSCDILKSTEKSKKDSNVKVAEKPKDSTVKSKESASSSKSGLVFHNSTWNDSHLASALLFLKEFCKDVKTRKFNERLSEVEYEDFSRACIYLSFKLESVTNHFTPTYGPGTVAERKEIDKNFYKDALKPEDFDLYVKWIAQNIYAIVGAYKAMIKESLNMTRSQLKTDTSTGPLKYGLVYNGYWWGEIISWLPPDIYVDSTFLEALKEFHKCLGNILKSPSEEFTVDSSVYDVDVTEKDTLVPNKDGAEIPISQETPTSIDKAVGSEDVMYNGFPPLDNLYRQATQMDFGDTLLYHIKRCPTVYKVPFYTVVCLVGLVIIAVIALGANGDGTNCGCIFGGLCGALLIGAFFFIFFRAVRHSYPAA
ncbi:secreted antigen 1 [Babesia divergens]|uniref:Secreted antigen 1 n=1 Tax=Babesia divergens TaxID=32595 RepID=A0AAD9GFU2_BABDI|nr:secreted antigen 1 [Babesia divergens]